MELDRRQRKLTPITLGLRVRVGFSTKIGALTILPRISYAGLLITHCWEYSLWSLAVLVMLN